MCSNLIYKVFYVIVHGVYTFFEYVSYVCDTVRLKVNHEFAPVADHYSALFFQSNGKKVPKHLTVLLGEEEPSYKDLANLIVWCMAARIPYISFYDCKGILKVNDSKLENAVNVRKEKSHHIVWQHENARNGIGGAASIHVKILTEEDGKQCIVNLSKNLAINKINIPYRIEDVNGELQKTYAFPEPDLGLCCGRTINLHNYPPWQIRVTEFLRLQSHHNITPNIFMDCLQRYSKCEQRLGK